jgi:hypothetical protein
MITVCLSRTGVIQAAFASGCFPVDAPLARVLGSALISSLASIDMSGLFSRSPRNAGKDGFRYTSSKQPSDLWRPVESTQYLDRLFVGFLGIGASVDAKARPMIIVMGGQGNSAAAGLDEWLEGLA